MSQFGIGFLEEFLVLVLSGAFAGICLYAVARFVVLCARGRGSVLGAGGPVLLLALLFFFLTIPRIQAAAAQGFPYVAGMGIVTAFLLSRARRGGAVSRGVTGMLFLGACAVLLTFSIFQFITGRHTSFRDGELVALVEAAPSEWPSHEIENDAVIVRYKDVRRPVPAVRLDLHYFDDGEPAPAVRVTLPGEKWGVGGEMLLVKNWYFFFGERTFCRLTGLDAKFADLATASVGYNLPGHDPKAERKPLEEEIPLLNRKLRDICRVETVKLGYDQFVYQPITAGRYFGIFLRSGGLMPKPLPAEEYFELLRAHFVDTYADIL